MGTPMGIAQRPIFLQNLADPNAPQAFDKIFFHELFRNQDQHNFLYEF